MTDLRALQALGNMNLCQKALELLMDLKRADFLPSFDEDGVRQVLSEMTVSFSKISEIMDDHGDDADQYAEALSYHNQCIIRNRLCINRFDDIAGALPFNATKCVPSFYAVSGLPSSNVAVCVSLSSELFMC